MVRLLPDLRRDRGDLLAATLERLREEGSSVAPHEAEYLAKSVINAYLVALSRGSGSAFAETVAALAEREARAGNALRVEAAVTAFELLGGAVRRRGLVAPELAEACGDALDLLEEGRRGFLRVYLRAKAVEDDRRAMALETFAEEAEVVPPIIYSTDEEGRLTDINHLAAELLGYRKEDLLGRHYSVLMRPADAARVGHFIQERRTDDRATRRVRVALRAADGTEKEFEVSSTGVYASDGRYIGADGIARAVQGEGPTLAYQLDAHGRLQEISEAAASALGYRREELLGEHFSVLMDPRERDRVGRMFGERRTDDRAANRLRVYLTGRDGARREFEISALGRYDAEGRFVGTIGLGSDLTEQSELARTVAEGRRKYRRVFDQCGMGLSLITPDLIVREANTWHLSRRRRPVTGGACYLGLFGHAEPCPWCGLREALETGQTVLREPILSPLDGRWYTLLFSPLTDEFGQPTGIIETVIDTSRERALRDREQAAEKRTALLRLARGLAEPLEDTLTRLALHLADDLAPTAAEAIDEVRRLERLAGLHNGWGEGAGQLNAVLEAVVAAEPRPLGIDLEIDLCPGLPPVALPAPECAEIVAHLLRNAIEAMPGGGVLTIETGLDPEGEVLLRVADTGEGMAEATVRQATDPFFTTREGRRGLGLTYCEGLLRGCGGQLEISSAPGSGTMVEIRLPPAADQPAGALPTHGEPLDLAGRVVTVRLAEPALQAAVEAALRRLGMSVGDEGEVALVEPRTPPGGGREIVLLGVGERADEGRERSAVPLRKPFGPAELAAALREALG